MAAKKVQYALDNVTFRTLPGNSGDLRQEMASFNDTVFGQNWQSEDESISRWMLTSNALFKGLAGYQATLKMGGTPITMTAEPMTLVSGKTYQVTNATKRLFDYASTLVVYDGVTTVTAQVLSVDYLSGTLTFLPTYTVVGAVTVDSKYVPLAVIAKGRGFNLTQTAADIETTDYETAQANGGYATFIQGLRTVSLEISGVYDTGNLFRTAMLTRAMIVVEISPPGDGTTYFRGLFKRRNFNQSGNIGALEQQTLSFGLFVPDGSLLAAPFGWYYTAGSTLNQAVRDIISAWQNGTIGTVKYLPDGGTTVNAGGVGTCVVTECSITNSLDGQNEFKFSFRGTGVLTNV